tara:strand:- start:2558 stop:2746 length:189 start_codon:yes stop_codon:yes gene_type:complete
MEFFRKYFNCTDYKLKYEKEKRKYEELLFFVEQMNNQHEEILSLIKVKKELQNKVAGVKFVK